MLTEKVKESNTNKMLIAEGRQVLAPVQRMCLHPSDGESRYAWQFDAVL